MKKLLITVAAISALSVGAPAAAQYRVGADVHGQIQQLQFQLDAQIRSGSIPRRDVMPLREQLRQLTMLERRYGYDGFTGRETADLQERIRMLRQRLRYAERGTANAYDRNRDGFDDRYDRNADGRDDRYDRNRDGADDRYDRNADGRDDRYDRNRDGADDRYDRNRDGADDRFDRDNDGADDRYDRNRDGADDRFDRDDDGADDRFENRGAPVDGRYDRPDGAALAIGQPAPADLGAVPFAYRTQYRDGDGAYFRSDGRFIYQIDTRTRTVVRIYPIDR
jgi:hypothetical protein